MKKRIVSLLCVLALCLGLLPVTALAAGEDAPGTLWVGRTQITARGYWKTTTEGNFETGSENDYNVYYDGNGTLTLNGATIQGGTSTGSVPYGAGIYAQCSNGQSVTLTIKLIGENTITGYYGIYVNAEIDASSYGTDATLTITGESNGSLKVSGSYHGIYVKSGTGGASLNINDASVVASSSSSYYDYAGVYVQSSAHATSSPQLSLAVNGGSLTTSASASGEGIKFYVGAFEATSATTSLTVTDNAIVDAKNGGISAKQISNPINTDISATGSNGGIVFDGKNGTVYGDVTLQEDLEIGKDETLTIPEGASLDMNGKTITVESGGKLEGTPTGSGTLKIAPTITTTTLPDGEVGTVYSQSLAANGDTPITWSLASGSTLPDGLALNESTGKITGTPSAAGEFKFTVTATNDAGSDSKEVTLNVKSVPVTGVTLDKQTLELYTGDSQPLTATVQPANATNKNVTWSSNDDTIATVDNNGNVTAVAAGTATITVTTEDGSHTATCTVTVKDPVYSMTTDTAVLSFDSKTEGYADAPAAKTVTITNTGNQPLTLARPASTANFEVGTLSATELPVNGTATFTVQPKTGLAAGNYEETITVTATGGQYNVATNVTVKFAVAQKSVSGSDTSTPDDSVYYTCPACGYHNWTATDAGYRCDHCGYLESVKQLSGYANVKGTYTPGSGATTAVTVPQTGDQSSPALWVALLSVSGLALCGLVLCRRRQH